MIIVVMGVAGAGKTTIGTLLAETLDCDYLEGDSLHAEGSITAMSHGRALIDADRAPWLAAIRARMVEAAERGEDLVVGCSALKESYRMILSDGLPVTWVYLKGAADLFRTRLRNRTGHFMGADMLDGQLDVLEEPRNAIIVDASLPPGFVVAQIQSALGRAIDPREEDS